MKKANRINGCGGGLVLVLLVLLLIPRGPALAQTDALPPRNSGDVSALPADEYRIGPADVLSVTFADAPEFSGKFRVSELGIIEIAGISTPIHAEGLTPIELSEAIRQAFIDAKQLRNPEVNVYIDEYRGRTFTVLGAVSKPGVFSLQKRTQVVEALSMAGGLLPNSGNTVTIVRGAASAEAAGSSVGSVQIIELDQLLKGQNPSANVEIRKGDIVNVSGADVVYVVGAVVKPGGYATTNPSAGVSVVQAVALAEGPTRIAATNRGLIIRQSTSGSGRLEIPVDISQMMSGKEMDALLAPNDILYIPESSVKKTLKVMGEIAMAAANGAAIYGVGYRAAGLTP